jgi:outer membrane lipoprotein carrier protein
MIKHLALTLVLAAAPVLADPSPREQLDQFAAGLHSLSGGFSQVTLDGSGRLVDQAEGRLYFQHPDRFRWSYVEPFPQEIVADGKQLWHYDESLDQVTVRDQPDASESPLLILTRPDLLDRFYRIEDSGLSHALEFSPLEEDLEFEQAVLFFDEGLPIAIELIDRFGQLTRLEMFDLERNPELDPELFTFEMPPGADLLEGY